jgi:hypothetical protein
MPLAAVYAASGTLRVRNENRAPACSVALADHNAAKSSVPPVKVAAADGVVRKRARCM